ncbi:hypothetical protein [Agromyces humi]|uniref:hypothetical protein n=1 Tax=Agromyces humi TaxID=1766800 RepID=UPI00135B5364|nr:hypothetical protein [Agromyces humi]
MTTATIYHNLSIVSDTLTEEEFKAGLAEIIDDYLYDVEVYEWEHDGRREVCLNGYGNAAAELETAVRTLIGARDDVRTVRLRTESDEGKDVDGVIITEGGDDQRFLTSIIPAGVQNDVDEVRALHTAGNIEAMVTKTLELLDRLDAAARI